MSKRIILALVALTVVLLAGVLGVHTASAAVAARVQNGTLLVSGDAASDKIALRLAPGAPSTLQVDVGDDGTADFTFARSTFTAVDVEAGGGDDAIRIDQVNGLFTDVPITLNGGSGNDTITGGDGGETLLGGSGDDVIDGNRGNDTAQLGGGNDTYQWDPGDGSDVVDGQGGRDTLAFNGSNAAEHIDVTANGPRVRLARDVAAITMDLDGIDTIAVRALGSADTITVGDLAGTATHTVAVDPGADGANDVVNVLGTSGDDRVRLSNADNGALEVDGFAARTQVSGGDPSDDVDLQSRDGDDTHTAGVGVTSTVQATFDGGPGTDASRYDGSSGDDQIGIALNGTAEAAFAPGSVTLDTLPTVESLLVSGHDGNDTIAGQNGLAAMAPLTIDGGPGDDTLLGGDGADLIQGGAGNDFVDGNRGNDQAFLGAGDDTFQWDPGDGSDVVEGQSGHDALAFNGSNIGEQIDISANGSRVRLTRNVAAVTLDLNGLDTIGVHALAGADAITVGDLSGTRVKTVTVDTGGADAQPDTVVVDGTDGVDRVDINAAGGQVAVAGLAATTQITGSEATDTLQVNTLGGRDVVTLESGVSALITPVIDLGADQ
jgi:Ca2+-binding RTX toxin-like protein